MLKCQSLTVRYGATTALDSVDIEVAAGDRLSIVGPSGCGKSTLLRAIAGLVTPDAGSVSWDGADLGGTPPHARGIGLVFQEHALFPHRDVAGNVAFGLRMQHIPAARIDERVDEVLTLVGLAHRRRSTIDELSGGERQRVALARTLAPGPELVLLDEPLASLDRVLRTELLDEMTSIFDTLEVTAIAVTHDLDEAFRFGDTLAVMSPGHIERIGPVDEVWDEPRTEFAARFLGYSPIAPPDSLSSIAAILAPPSGLLAAIPPDGFAVADDGVSGRVVRATFESGEWRHVVELGDGSECIVHTVIRHDGEVRLRLDVDRVRFVQPTSSAV